MFLRKDNPGQRDYDQSSSLVAFRFLWLFLLIRLHAHAIRVGAIIEPQTEEDVGLLVQVSFYITAFTLPAYRRGSLPRPSKDDSS